MEPSTPTTSTSTSLRNRDGSFLQTQAAWLLSPSPGGGERAEEGEGTGEGGEGGEARWMGKNDKCKESRTGIRETVKGSHLISWLTWP